MKEKVSVQPSDVGRSEFISALKFAFPRTVPIMTGFLFLGISCGIFMVGSGFPFYFPILSSVFVFAGSMEFALVSLLLAPFDPISAIFMTLMINARHIFYGISMLEKYKGTGKKKPYLIFAMCDESFSVNCSLDLPENLNRGLVYFLISLLNQSYWIIGSTLGGLAGSFLKFEIKGIDFVMTAMFIVIFIEQWLKHKNHICEIAGLVISVVCLLIFGKDSFILPSMAAILVFLSASRTYIEKIGEKENECAKEGKT